MKEKRTISLDKRINDLLKESDNASHEIEQAITYRLLKYNRPETEDQIRLTIKLYVNEILELHGEIALLKYKLHKLQDVAQ